MPRVTAAASNVHWPRRCDISSSLHARSDANARASSAVISRNRRSKSRSSIRLRADARWSDVRKQQAPFEPVAATMRIWGKCLCGYVSPHGQFHCGDCEVVVIGLRMDIVIRGY